MTFIHLEICEHCNRLFVRMKEGKYRRDITYYFSEFPEIHEPDKLKAYDNYSIRNLNEIGSRKSKLPISLSM